jgi:hypothetical protein
MSEDTVKVIVEEGVQNGSKTLKKFEADTLSY